jgi:hypothetical protein
MLKDGKNQVNQKEALLRRDSGQISRQLRINEKYLIFYGRNKEASYGFILKSK